MQVDRDFYTVVSDTPYNYLLNHIKAVLFSGARVSQNRSLVPHLTGGTSCAKLLLQFFFSILLKLKRCLDHAFEDVRVIWI